MCENVALNEIITLLSKIALQPLGYDDYSMYNPRFNVTNLIDVLNSYILKQSVSKELITDQLIQYGLRVFQICEILNAADKLKEQKITIPNFDFGNSSYKHFLMDPQN